MKYLTLRIAFIKKKSVRIKISDSKRERVPLVLLGITNALYSLAVICSFKPHEKLFSETQIKKKSHTQNSHILNHRDKFSSLVKLLPHTHSLWFSKPCMVPVKGDTRKTKPVREKNSTFSCFTFVPTVSVHSLAYTCVCVRDVYKLLMVWVALKFWKRKGKGRKSFSWICLDCFVT